MGVSGGGGRRRQPARVEPEGRRRAVSGTSVTAKNLSWNGTVAAGSSVSFGFTGSRSGTNTEPVSFKLGDRTCTVT
ncbi:cellulose binding domain-containing protein [Streptomyces sp. NPDC047869]|uniref:cellulose binding domain-containing protein n=1 Tax=Streptomyces sp. NPDC047869 TaxID=3154709 RepID=UPI003456253D